MLDPNVDGFLDDLLEYVEEGRVVPIIGDELLQVRQDGVEVPLYDHLARRLAERLSIPVDQLPPKPDLNAVVCQHLRGGGLPEDVYPKIRSIMSQTRFAPPEALLQLARIDRFNLFVVLTFDSLLVQALDQVRFAGESRTVELSYTPKNVQDLPSEKEALRQPVVYHLLGRLSAHPDYVITEEDTLEFLHHMQSTTRQAELLFDALRDNHLLFIGCRLSDWLVRFLIRITKRRQLSLRRSEMELLVATDADRDRELVAFLRHYSPRTKIAACSAVAFVAELEARYRQRTKPVPVASSAAAAAKSDAMLSGGAVSEEAASTGMEEGAIFLSYASEDYESVRRLRDFLEHEAGLDVWFDKRRLEGGDDYDQQIRRHIKNCSYFLPVISAAASRRLEGYFRKEWAWAADRAVGFAEDVPFIVPIVIDDTGDDARGIPERFKRSHWTRLPDGAGDEGFRRRMVTLVRDHRKRARG